MQFVSEPRIAEDSGQNMLPTVRAVLVTAVVVLAGLIGGSQAQVAATAKPLSQEAVSKLLKGAFLPVV